MIDTTFYEGASASWRNARKASASLRSHGNTTQTNRLFAPCAIGHRTLEEAAAVITMKRPPRQAFGKNF
jgi:hypothetical protein